MPVCISRRKDQDVAPPIPKPIESLLARLKGPEREAAAAELFDLAYRELRRIAGGMLRRERAGHTLQPTALVHEAFIRLIGQERAEFAGRTHFLAICADAMRRVLVDHARHRRRLKRGGQWHRVALQDADRQLGVEDLDLVAFHDALERLRTLDERQARVVELRFFGGMSMHDVAEALGVSKRTAEGDWTHARAWLRQALADQA